MAAQLRREIPLIRGTKKPVHTDWQLTKPGQFTEKQLQGRRGLALDADMLVLDFDPKNYPEGRDIFAELQSKIVPTKTVITPSGGTHFYYHNPYGVMFRVKQEKYPGLDCLSLGQQVCVEGTETNDGIYVLGKDLPIATLPMSFLRILEQARPEDWEDADTTITDDQSNIEKYTAWLKVKAPPAIEGQHGNEQTFKVACEGKDLGLSRDLVLALITEHYNRRCKPMWSDRELSTIVNSAYKNGKAVPGVKDIKQHDVKLDLVAPPPGKSDKVDKIVKMRGQHIAVGMSQVNERNPHLVVNHTTLRIMIEQDEYIGSRVYWDDFSQRVMWTEKPTWRIDNHYDGMCWTDHDTHILVDRLNAKLARNIGEESCIKALHAYAFTNRRHSVREWLESLEWDGEPRLDTILIDTAGAEDMAYTRAVGKNVLLSAVQRIYEPGCMAKSILMLDGKQDALKSTWVRTLAVHDDWLCEGDRLAPGDKDVYQNLRGKWIIELPEIDKDLVTRDKAWLKSFISRRVDTYRRSFGRESYDHPRQSIFIGTLNGGRDAYLTDPTGNVRFWIVDVLQPINITKLKENLTQYWAEAVFRYKQHEPTYLNTVALKEQAAEVAKRKMVDNPYVSLLHKKLKSEVTYADCYRVLGITAHQINGRVNTLISDAMFELGYRKVDKVKPVLFKIRFTGLPELTEVE